MEQTSQSLQYALPPPIRTDTHTQPRSCPTSPTHGKGSGQDEGTMGATARPRADTKPREKRDVSQTRQGKISVKDIGIMVYLRKSSRYVIDAANTERRDILRGAIL